MAPLTPLSGPVYVDQPPVGSIRYGLWAAAGGPFDMPHHAEVGGVQYLEEHCGQGHLWAAASCSSPTVNGGVKPIDPCDGTAVGLPFTALASLTMGAISWTQDEIARRVNVRLTDNAQQVCENAFWGGNADVADNWTTFVASGGTLTDVTPTPGTAVSIELGVGLLENYIANYGYPGVFHAQPVVSPFATERLLSVPNKSTLDSSQRYLTPMGNRWSFGRGYSGNKPGANGTVPVAGTAYIAVTGPVNIWRGQAYTNPIWQTMTRTTNPSNQVLAIAEQPYAITIDCTAAFVLINLAGMS